MHPSCFFSSFTFKIITTDQIKSTSLITRDMTIVNDPATTYEGDAIINFGWQFALERGSNNLGYCVNHHNRQSSFDRTNQQTACNVSFQNNSDNNNRDDHDQDQHRHIPPLWTAGGVLS